MIAAMMLAGCESQIEIAPETDGDVAAIGERFDSTQQGRIRGSVYWRGPAPVYPPIASPLVHANGTVTYREFPNPNVAKVDLSAGGVEGAVVYLENVDIHESPPWQRGPVRVEILDERIHVLQDGETRSIGFVRVGDEVEIVSRHAYPHVLSARGSAFFSLAFPDPDRPLRRRFAKPGLVELSSGAAKYWHRSYLWICEHSHFTLTDAAGRFEFLSLPRGDFRVIAWLPNPDIAAIDRDPNTGMPMRFHFGEPFKAAESVRLESNQTDQVNFLLPR